MSLTHAAGASGPDLGARTARRSLRAERAQLQHWRRLLRARLDLAVADFVPPEPLGELTWDLLPGASTELPSHAELASAVAVVTPIDPVELMTRLRTLDRALAGYGQAVDEAIEQSTERVVALTAASAGDPDRGADQAR